MTDSSLDLATRMRERLGMAERGVALEDHCRVGAASKAFEEMIGEPPSAIRASISGVDIEHAGLRFRVHGEILSSSHLIATGIPTVSLSSLNHPSRRL